MGLTLAGEKGNVKHRLSEGVGGPAKGKGRKTLLVNADKPRKDSRKEALRVLPFPLPRFCLIQMWKQYRGGFIRKRIH